MTTLKIDLEQLDFQDFKDLMHDCMDNPFLDSRIAKVVLKQIEENER